MNLEAIKTVKVIVKEDASRYAVSQPIYKEDYGLYFLIIEGLELPEVYTVDFSNSETTGNSVPMLGNSDGVLIPRRFIDTGKDIFAFLYITGDGFGRTVYKFKIPNRVRPDRTNEEPEPEEQSLIDQAISALNDAVEKTAEDRENADASAQSAYESADEAQRARDDAQTFAQRSANSAQESADYSSSAQASATASAQSASDAETARQETTSLVEEAQRYANASEQSATASANSAEQAESAKGVAQSYAQDAQTSATYASTSESTAIAKAQEASGYAQTASDKAAESAQSATNAQTYATQAENAKTASQTAQGLAEGARDSAVNAKNDAESARDAAQTLVDGITGKVEQIDANTDAIESLEDDCYKPYATDTANGRIASFTDGADDVPLRSLTITLEPQQDLHGHESPWVGGAGKNLLDPTLLKDQVAWNIIPFYAPVGTVLTMSTNQPGVATSGLLTYFRTPGGTQGANENVLDTHSATKTVGEEGYLEIVQRNRDNIKSYADYEYQIEVGETATEYEPYENICPITGHTGLNLYRTGGNLICKTLPEDAFVCGSIRTGDTTIQSGTLYRGYCVYVGKNTAIRYTKEGTSSFTVGLAFADEYITKSAGSVIYNALNMANRENNTLNSGEHPYLVIVVAKSSVDNQTFNTRQVQTFFKTDNGDPIRYSPTHDIDKYHYDWTEEAGTVYGCTLDVLTGVLSINKVIVDVGSLQIGATNPTLGIFSFALPNCISAGGNGTTYDAICDAYKFTTTGDNEAHGDEDSIMWMYKSSVGARVKDSRYIRYSASEAKAALSGVNVVYPLATPIEIQLEPHELASIFGGNQIWTDNGTIDIEYRADTKLYIERLTAPDSADMIADANITSGQYFMIGNSLYKATANIANGGQIVVGTNATRVSLAQALNEINA